MPDAFSAFRWITTWKSIAAHCDVSIDTVRRWEKAQGLPVHRLPSKTGFGCGLVCALPSELDAWLRAYTAGEKALKIDRARRKAADRAAGSNNERVRLH